MSALAFQITIAGLLVIGSRALTGVRPDLAGVLDDASLAALYGSLQLATARLSRPWLRRGLALGLVLLLSVAVFSNQVFFSYFQTYLSISSLRLAGIALDASTSIRDLITPTSVVVLLSAPVALQLLALRFERPPSRDTVWACFFAGLLLGGVGSGLREGVFLFAQHNPQMSLLRDAGSRAALALGWSDREGPGAGEDVLGLLNREGYPGYEPAAGPDHPLWQRPAPGTESPVPAPSRPNVVIVLMESMRGLEGRGLFRELPVTPRLDALESRALVFDDFYANGMTTVDGELSVLCSVLPVVNEAPVYIRKPDLDVRCLPEILREHGYATHWISAYSAAYSNKRAFLKRHGVARVHDRESLDPERARHPEVGWGMGDVDMFDQALERIDGFREPFFVEIMTLSNHHPFDHDYDLAFPDGLDSAPGDAHYRDYLRGMYYTDHAVGGFLAAAAERPWFDRTLFVIVGDHAVRAYPERSDGERPGPVLETEIYFRGRLMLYAPELIEPRRLEVLGSQIDVAPTLLDLLGIRTPNSFLGVSLLAELPAERRFALMNIGHVWNIRNGDHYCYSVGYSCFRETFPRCADGVRPRSAGHTCFELEGDLLDEAGLGRTRILEPIERARTLDRARRIMDLNRRLIELDRFRPSTTARGSQ